MTIRYTISLDGYTCNVVKTLNGGFAVGSHCVSDVRYVFQHVTANVYRISTNDGSDKGKFKLVPFPGKKSAMHFVPML